MRILMLTSSYPKYSGETTAPFIEEIAAALVARGHTVHVVAPFHPEVKRNPVERGVHLHFFRYAPHPALNVWGYAQSLFGDTHLKWQTVATIPFALAGSVIGLARMGDTRHHISQHRFDILHAHWVIPNGPPAALVARWYKLPLVISLHGSDIYVPERHRAIAPVAGITLRYADGVTACSADLHRRSVHLGADPTTSCVIPYGINPQEFCPNPQAYTQMRSEFGLPHDAPFVVAIGRMVYKKGFDVLLDAWPQVLHHHPQAHLALIGYGDLRDSLKQQANRLGIAHSVSFPGQLERRRAAAAIAAADVFALPIVRDQGVDGLPNTLLEAMGAARPIVASRVAGVPDVITDEVHGLLVPDRDPHALAMAINRLLDHPEFAHHLGAMARQRIETTLTWDHTAARFEQMYHNVLGK